MFCPFFNFSCINIFTNYIIVILAFSLYGALHSDSLSLFSVSFLVLHKFPLLSIASLPLFHFSSFLNLKPSSSSLSSTFYIPSKPTLSLPLSLPFYTTTKEYAQNFYLKHINFVASLFTLHTGTISSCRCCAGEG